jgi:hypothetical protein
MYIYTNQQQLSMLFFFVLPILPFLTVERTAVDQRHSAAILGGRGVFSLCDVPFSQATLVRLVGEVIVRFLPNPIPMPDRRSRGERRQFRM